MKGAVGCISIIISVFAVSLSVFATYLLYVHVEATQLMWFLWFMMIPLQIMIQLLGIAAKEIFKK